jgi:hypothetical protein
MQPLQLVSFILDGLLVLAAIAAYLARPRLGGELAKGLRILMSGVMLLGFAHLTETLMFVVFSLSLQVNEIIHRLLVGAGIVLVMLGFIIMRRAFEE